MRIGDRLTVNKRNANLIKIEGAGKIQINRVAEAQRIIKNSIRVLFGHLSLHLKQNAICLFRVCKHVWVVSLLIMHCIHDYLEEISTKSSACIFRTETKMEKSRLSSQWRSLLTYIEVFFKPYHTSSTSLSNVQWCKASFKISNRMKIQNHCLILRI